MDKFDPDTLAIISDPSYRIFTTLRYNVFNEADVQNPTATIATWRKADEKLLDLHSQRLQASARAFDWLDVATLLESEGISLLKNNLETALSAPAIVSTMVPEKGHFIALRAHVDVSRNAEFDVHFVPMGSAQPLSALETDRFHEIPAATPPGSRPSARPDSDFCKVSIDSQATPSTVFTSHKTSHRSFYNESRARAGISQASPLQHEVMLYNTSDEITEASVSTVYFYRDGRWVTPAAECGGNLGVTRRLALQAAFCVEAKVSLGGVHDGEGIWLSNAAREFFRGWVVKS